MSYTTFISRLTTLYNNKQFPKALLARIKQSDLETILLTIVNDASLGAKIDKAKPHCAIRLAKEDTGLARTIALLRTPDGQYQCILETENLDANNEVCEVEEFDGLLKKGTTAWRLDCQTGPSLYASLHVELSKAKKLNFKSQAVATQLAALNKEIKFSWHLPENDYIVRSAFGATYSNDNGSYINIYSPYGIRLDDIDTHITLTHAIKNKIVTNVLKALHFLHKQGFIHQDIKPGNILVFLNEHDENDIKVKFIDFGTVTSCDNTKFRHPINATVGYESPEIALVKACPLQRHHEEYEAVYKEDGKTFAKKCADEMAKHFKSAHTAAKHKTEYLKPHPKNDVWATAVMLYEFLHDGETPDTLPEDPLLKNMLAARDIRFSAKEALNHWEASLPNNQAIQRSYLPRYNAIKEEKLPSLKALFVDFVYEKIDRAKRFFGFA